MLLGLLLMGLLMLLLLLLPNLILGKPGLGNSGPGIVVLDKSVGTGISENVESLNIKNNKINIGCYTLNLYTTKNLMKNLI
jgi:hypothetical protein